MISKPRYEIVSEEEQTKVSLPSRCLSLIQVLRTSYSFLLLRALLLVRTVGIASYIPYHRLQALDARLRVRAMMGLLGRESLHISRHQYHSYQPLTRKTIPLVQYLNEGRRCYHPHLHHSIILGLLKEWPWCLFYILVQTCHRRANDRKGIDITSFSSLSLCFPRPLSRHTFLFLQKSNFNLFIFIFIFFTPFHPSSSIICPLASWELLIPLKEPACLYKTTLCQ